MSLRVITLVLCLDSLILAFHPTIAADGPPELVRGGYGVVTNAVAMPGQVRQDTLYLMGGPGDWSGRFENPHGTPNWHGWEHLDLTDPTVTHWNVSTYWGDQTGANPGPDNHVAYCGDETIPSCEEDDPVGGYGDSWIDFLEWRGTVANNTQPTTVAIDYHISHDVEPNYDYLYFKVERQDGWAILRTYNGGGDNLHETFDFSVGVADYVGPDGDQIHLRFEFVSDHIRSDEDCSWPTHGAAQIDDIEVSLDGEVATFDDFESGEALGSWESVLAPGVGDFAQLMNDMWDIDECVDNHSWQVVFIDDGIVVPELEGTECISWCYGPEGWIVNNSGGLAGPDFYLHNRIVSPPLEWPESGQGGAILAFGVYRHEEFYSGWAGWPGIFYQWGVRSVDTGNPDDLENAFWQSRNFVYFGGPEYFRHSEAVSDLLVPGPTHVQVALDCREFGYFFGWNGDDGTPAPYFDNVAFKVFDIEGPVMSAREIDLAQDTFPDRDSIDYGNLQLNWCRFDMAQDISQHAGIDPGDSIVVSISPLRAGAELTGPPRLHYILQTNPLFNAVRGTELGTPDAYGRIIGYVEGTQVMVNGDPVPGDFAFDLPDSAHFYPGDRLRYIIAAEDAIGGVADPQSSTLPADTTGFSLNFTHNPMLWQMQAGAKFAVNFLPTMFSNTPGDQAKILFWNDYGGRGGQNEWHYAIRNAGFQSSSEYDTYYTNGPSSGVGNGLGSRATMMMLAGYKVLLYSSGDLSQFTIVNADLEYDESPDTEVLNAWFELGHKHAFFTGDNLAYDLNGIDVGFLNTWFGVDWQQRSLRGFIDNQTTPVAVITANNPVFSSVFGWLVNGGCPIINTFDGVSLRANCEIIAEFTNPQGNPGGYQFPAATYYEDEHDNETVYLPYDLLFVQNDPQEDNPTPMSARARIVRDVLISFGRAPGPSVDVPETYSFAARVYPNPFNPKTTIAYTLPRAGAVTVKIFNLRGELVRTLLDEARQPAGPGEVVWAGENDQGGQVASGVYFYEVKAGDQRKVAKMTLVK